MQAQNTIQQVESQFRRGDYEECIVSFKAVLEKEPTNTTALQRLGSALFLLGRYPESLETYVQLKDLAPDSLFAVHGIADNLDRLGQYEKAFQVLEPHLNNPKVSMEIVLDYAKVAPHIGQADQAITRLLSYLEQPKRTKIETAFTNFCLGNLYNRTAEYDKAFACYQKANDLRRGNYDPKATQAYFKLIASIFSSKTLGLFPRANPQGPCPVFVVGMPRSGTSLVEKIVDTHPKAFGAGELQYLPRLVEGLPQAWGIGEKYPVCMKHATTDRLHTVAEQYLAKQRSSAPDQVQCIVDKLPTNFVHLGLINLALPHAKVIHCLRDPMDTCVSCYFQNFDLPFTNSLADLGHTYCLYRSLMKHWQSVLDTKILDVSYERLVENPEPQIRRIIEFLGLAWDPACLKFHKSGRITNTCSYKQVTQPIYQRSVGRHALYAKHLESLGKALSEAWGLD